ncbi:MAG TPA: LuxR C-terminal-related transcriptional regulator [Solirubrobacterales bacterium]|jgi:LuxR family maltose regulon positive regulatory protein|nr:LuxR C-terminal-related transcriptional regulator [Solirubrobacterales bacterium]
MRTPEHAAETDRRGLLRRTELLATLERATRKRVTIVSAPAGSGKTTLLREWARRSTDRVEIVSTRPGEMDAQRFEDVLALLESPPEPVTLIVDDLHELKSAEALARLEALVEKLPATARVILASRRDPQIHLHRMRLADEVAEIRANDLQLSESETGALLRESGLTLSEEAVASLHERTEGWAAGLRLAAISMADHPDPERFVAEFSGGHRAVAEYLIAEMLDAQPADVRCMLLRSSLLDRVNGELADLLGEGSGSERVLLELEDANAFVVSLDPERTWFRFHQLLTDFLRLELRRTTADDVPVLHRRAAGWFLGHGDVPDAVRHTLAAGDWADGVEIISDHVFGLALDGHAEIIDSLLSSFPRGAATDHPELALARAITQLERGRLEEAATQLAYAESHLGTISDARNVHLAAAVVASRQSLARQKGQLAAVIDQVGVLDSPPDGDLERPPVLTADLRAVTMMHLGIVEMWSGRFADAEAHLLEGVALARESGRHYLEVACQANLGFVSSYGSYDLARERSEAAIELAERHGWGDRPVTAPALVTIGGAMVTTGEFDEAGPLLDRAASIVDCAPDPAVQVHLHAAAGMLRAARGDHEGALEQFELADRSESLLECEHVLAGHVSGWLSATLARLGRPGEARAYLAALPEGRSEKAEIRTGWAAIHLSETEPELALDSLHGVVSGEVPVGHPITLVKAHLLAAQAYRQMGYRSDAIRATEDALAAAEEERIIVPFAVCEGLALLEALPSHATAHGALAIEIREAIAGSAPARPTEPDDADMAPLSPSELRVLGYLPTNLTRPEIAGELFVSLNTVNTHIRNIYAKLGVNGRSDAVAAAREGKLLAAGRSR